jgi:hypothetical protein
MQSIPNAELLDNSFVRTRNMSTIDNIAADDAILRHGNFVNVSEITINVLPSCVSRLCMIIRILSELYG